MIRYNLIWRLSLKNQGRDDHIFLMQFVSGHVYTGPGLWKTFFVFAVSKNSIIAVFLGSRALLKQPLWYQSLSLCSLISFEIVVGSLQRYLAMSLKEQPAFRNFSMYLRSSRVRCFWLPGIYLLMLVLLLLLSEGQHEHTIYDMKD